MTLDEFAAVSEVRIPTPAEFVAFVAGQGWRIDTDGTRATLKAPASDPMAVATARMLGREPYRTNVLAVVLDRQGLAQPDPTGEPREDVVVTDPKGPAPAMGLTTLDVPQTCRDCRATILAVPDEVTLAFCERMTCPYRRTGSMSFRGSRAS